MMVTITDTAGTGGSVTVDRDQAVDAIRDWFPDPTPVITQTLNVLQDALNHGDYTEGIATYLGIRIDQEGSPS
jgi:hypothetical protein